MRQQKLLLNISELLSRFKVQVGILNASAMLDINIIAEIFFIPILNEIYDCDLKNMNLIEKNYPAIDLADKTKKIAIQITSTSTTKKVRETLEKIVKNNFYNIYNNFFILIITSKQEEYNSDILSKATEGKFHFTNDNIIDVESLFRLITSLSITKIEKIEQYLRNQYTDVNKTNNLLEKNLPKIKSKMDYFQDKYVKSKLETAYGARQEWYEKKAYFETKLPNISDITQIYTIEKHIAECNMKIKDYENEISSITNQINDGDN